MIIDAHAHIFPDKIAEKAVEGISSFYDGIKIKGKGTVRDLLMKGAAAEVDRYIVQSVATVPEQVRAINNFISSCVAQHPRQLIGFGSLHPDFPDIEWETERIISLGLRGVKLHSEFQGFDLDDERVFPIYEACEGRLPILFHMGDERGDRSAPERMLNVIKRFPKLTVIGAHFAGWSMWDRSAEVLGGSGIYTDCSSSLYAMTPEHAAELIRRFGADKVLWGTDYPLWTAKEELARFRKIPLTTEEREQILGMNAVRLLNLSCKYYSSSVQTESPESRG